MPNIEKREITSELKESYLDYAMSVIVARALPDVRDGLKPVQRRILWAMWDSGLTADAKLRKSANVVGEVMGRYHPHGDTAIYDTLVRLAQDFSLRYPLIIGQGNWGSIDGDNAAAMRYCITGNTLIATEHGLKKIEDISKDNKEDIHFRILSHNRNINHASKWFDSGEHPTRKVTTKRGYSITGSYNHPLLTWKKTENGTPQFSWKMIGELKKEDAVVIDRSTDILWPQQERTLKEWHPKLLNNRTERKTLPFTMTNDLAFILGALISEGTISKKKIEFCNSDSVFIVAFKKAWRNTFPDCRLHEFIKSPSSFGKKPYARLEIHAKHVIEFLINIGLDPVRSAHKKIPFSVLESPKHVVAAFLRSYFEGDGTISSSGRMIELSAISISEELIDHLQTVLLRFGIATAKRYDRYRHTFKLYIRGLSNYHLFDRNIGFVSERKNSKLKNSISRLTKDNGQTDTIPYLAAFVRSLIPERMPLRQFVLKNNFDRYATLEARKESIATATQSFSTTNIAAFFENISYNHYLFDSIEEIEEAGVQRVFSIRVDSTCHSFVGNGFINHNTETKLSKISAELLTDIEKETVDWQPNYDGSRMEPKVLPAKLPHLLLNGAVGIAVGMATSIPPHNLGEVVDAVLYLITNPKATPAELANFVKGPDFPTGGIIFDRRAIAEAYATGRGSITMRGIAEVTERPKTKGAFSAKAGPSSGWDIVITEIPYQVVKAELVVKIAELVTEKKIEGIRDIRDESDKEGLRVVIELKNDAAPQKILNQLYQHTDLQKDFHLNMIALVDVLDPNDRTGQTRGLQPQVLSLKDVLTAYVAHREEVVRRRTTFELKRAEERAHILEGLSKALSVIDKIIATIKKSADRDEAKKNLIAHFKLTEIQATAILEMRLQTLAALEQKKIEDELKEKRKLITDLKALLASPAKIRNVIKDELTDIRARYADERRTKVVATGLSAFKEEDLIPQEETIITFSGSGYVKRLPPGTFRSQRRGGKGLIGSEVAEEDFLTHLIAAHTHDNILFFTDRGRVFQTKVWEIPAASRTAKGKPIHNFLEIPSEENVKAIVAYPEPRANEERTRESAFVMMATERGVVKKTSLADFGNVRRTGIIAMKLKKGDLLKWVKMSGGKDEIIITTHAGQSIRFKESQIRSMGRAASGVRAIRLKGGDEVSSMDVVLESSKSKVQSSKLLVVMANGYGKQTPLAQYRLQRRGGSGIKTAKITKKTGLLMTAHLVTDEEEIIALSSKGQILKTRLADVRVAGRATQGVKIMTLNAGDKLVAAICL